MDDLIAFLHAQLAEDEQVAQAAEGLIDEQLGWAEVSVAAAMTHIERHDPDRVLRDVAADRKLITAYINIKRRLGENTERYVRMMRNPGAHADRLTNVKTHGWELKGREEGLRYALMVRAERFADRPGYKESWRP